MKTVRNCTRKPVKIALDGGHVLHLGPNHTGQVADHATDRPAFRRLVELGELVVLETDDVEDPIAVQPTGPATPHGATRSRSSRLASGRTAGGRRDYR